MKNRFKKKGFTLIELLVVMAVISILVLLAIPKFMGYTEKARLTEMKSNIKQLETASERYYIDHQEWPRMGDEPYNAEDIESFAQEIKNKTGAIVTLDPEGNYYEINYDKLQKYVQKPKGYTHYILQNPVGEVFYLDKLTEVGKDTLSKDESTTPESPTNNKPVAIITMTPEITLLTTTNIIWSHLNSTDPDGDTITNAEWEGKQDTYTTAGTYTVRLRVQDSKGLWSDWVQKQFQIKNATEVIQIASGYNSSYVLRADGTVWSAGYNGYGQLGNSSLSDSYIPVQVVGLTNVIQVAAGQTHALALKDDGTVWAWGLNSYGELGDGTNNRRITPVKISTLNNVKQIACGSYHSMAILNDGSVWTWGYNYYGQLGDGTNINKWVPTKITILDNGESIRAGESHSLLLKTDGTVWSWGRNNNGQLGNNTTTNSSTPVQVPNLNNVTKIYAGWIRSMAIKSDGVVVGWGYNQSRSMGRTSLNTSVSPVVLPEFTGVEELSLGEDFTLMLKTDGTVWGIGGSYQGQIGDGTYNNQYAQPKQTLVSSIIQISSGKSSSIVLDSNNQIWGFGNNGYGEIGYGTNFSYNTPVKTFK